MLWRGGAAPEGTIFEFRMVACRYSNWGCDFHTGRDRAVDPIRHAIARVDLFEANGDACVSIIVCKGLFSNLIARCVRRRVNLTLLSCLICGALLWLYLI